MKIKQIIGSLFILAIFSFVSPVFAGGPLASISADSNGWVTNDGYGRIIRFYLSDSSIPCKNTQVTFKFTDSQDGDYVTTDSGTATHTFQDYGNGECKTYVKMASKKSATRMVTAVVMSEGKTIVDPYIPTIKVDFDGQYHADSAYNSYNYRSSTDNPYSSYYPTPTPVSSAPQTPGNLRITQVETTGDPNIRNVHLMWDPIPGVNSYTIYAVAPGSTPYYNYDSTVDTNLVEKKIRTSSTFYVAVTAKKDGQESSYSQTLTIDLANGSTPVVTPSATINAYIINQELDGLKRAVTVKWGAFDGNPGTFSILVKALSDASNWDKPAWELRGPSATVNIPNEDYYLEVYGCMDKYGTCAASSIILLPKIQVKDGKAVVVSPIPLPSGDPRLEELNKKVNELQNQLDQSKKTQSFLEQRINTLVSFIKKIFPFFK